MLSPIGLNFTLCHVLLELQAMTDDGGSEKQTNHFLSLIRTTAKVVTSIIECH